MPRNQDKLFRACAVGDLSVVTKLLVKEDVNINQLDDVGRVPLHFACSEDHEEVVLLLLTQDEINDFFLFLDQQVY